jgi:hypothetical protein
VTTLDVYDAKAALVDLLQAAAVPAGTLAGVDVAYAWDAGLGTRSLYGGGVAFDVEDAVGEPGTLSRETATVTFYAMAINRPPTPVEDTDTAVKAIRTAVQAILKANPKIGGVWSWEGVIGGRGDYSRTDDETVSRLSLQIRLGTYASW